MCKREMTLGDKTFIELNGLGVFTATVHKVTDDKVMLIFDDYVAEKPMNATDTNNGGFEDSDLNAWLHTEFVKALPYSIRARLTDVTIPTVGEMFGWDDEWDRNHFEADNDKQLPLGLMIVSCLAAYLDKISEFAFIVTVLAWPLLIIAGIIGLIMWLFITAGDKIGEFLRRKFDDEK